MSRSASEILRNHFRHQYGLKLGERTPSEILLVVHSTAPVEVELAFEVRGQAADGRTASVLVTRSEVRRAVRQGGPTYSLQTGLRTAPNG